LLPLEILVPTFAILVLSLSFHEAAHAWSADRLGDSTARLQGRLTLNPLAHIDWIGTVLFPIIAILTNFPLIGWAKPVPVDVRNLRAPRRDFALVAAAGPVSNLVLAAGAAVIFGLLRGAGTDPDGVGTIAYILFQAVSLNVLLAVFNLLPVPPLDGGNVAMGLLPDPLAGLIAQLRPWGFLILYLLMFSGALASLINPVRLALIKWLLL
jgi:Zn-dependent protease